MGESFCKVKRNNLDLIFVKNCRLQLKGELFWYRRCSQIDEMVLDGSSRAEFWTDLCENSKSICVQSNNKQQIILLLKTLFSVVNILLGSRKVPYPN